ncbi:hypothetical protein BCR37DRAFT_164350 [Protomyces lactucae-debilis]|uniref:Uncharacterized protein n=1 Tax=Protomyces lactucae-debilis TaxID=2754530 RepID=A0A1Y2EXJ9_PROLT|nr:uncharacterized protein BCR37DRAFT_164350 [Protomyces lactucae-debilis]ORY76342.1 hypothetical protein BCR37DRAFT_164350 [Protomyces lactucae-debilis]
MTPQTSLQKPSHVKAIFCSILLALEPLHNTGFQASAQSLATTHGSVSWLTLIKPYSTTQPRGCPFTIISKSFKQGDDLDSIIPSTRDKQGNCMLISNQGKSGAPRYPGCDSSWFTTRFTIFFATREDDGVLCLPDPVRQPIPTKFWRPANDLLQCKMYWDDKGQLSCGL